MKKTISIFIFLFLYSYGITQGGFNKLSHDFGEVYAGNERFVDIIYTNSTGKSTYLLTVKNQREVRVLTSNKKIEPDSTLILRFKYNPTKKGKFNIETPIYLSHSMDPFIFKMKGNIKEIDNSLGLDCPSFREKNIYEEQSFMFKALVLDAQTNEPINKAEIKLINSGWLLTTLKTNNKGKAKEKIPLGMYYLVTSAEGYYGNERAKYLNKSNDSVIIYLNKPKEEITVVENPVTISHEDTIEIILGTNKTIIDSIADTIGTNNPILRPGPPEYAPNNVVFLLDISSSMNHSGKLDLLKASMIELTYTLRSVDKITIVAYSTFSKVLLKTTSGDKKEEIIEAIKSIKAQGLTAGGDGMKQAYKEAYKNFIEEGNNQVIMATDGDFNRGTTNVDKLVKKYIKRGVKISVLGIKNKDMHVKDMQEIAQLGEGHYLFIDNYAISKTILIEEIRKQSLIIK